ncbi:hypothetical protein EB796_016696 [Bugula neritina]|uniref:Uncharacterized protein n=1 Tax=Bugula neritina TaxID=10212 RepID=A0A7J7JFY1_BUGNE|nr:hypothetical protein EB796_016696 [Bugula neritina]
MNFVVSRSGKDSQQTSKKRRKSQKADGTTDRSDYASNYSLRSGKSIPPSLAGSRSGSGIANSGDASMSETNINGSTSKIRKKRRRKPAVNVSSTKIESLGVDLADIEDDIVDEGTDAEADNSHQVTHKNHMKSQPIGKLFIEQTRGFKSTGSRAMEELYTEDQRNKQKNEDEEGAYPVQISAIAFAVTSIKVLELLLTSVWVGVGILAD